METETTIKQENPKAEKKPAAKKPSVKKDTEKTPPKKSYIEAVGRRKTSVARVRLFSVPESEGAIEINQKNGDVYFFTQELLKTATASLRKMKLLNKFFVTAKISGGGIHSQAEAFRHATARALVKFNLEFRKRLKRSNYLKRDPRAKERRKFGLKKARKSPQWSKR